MTFTRLGKLNARPRAWGASLVSGNYAQLAIKSPGVYYKY